MEKYIVFSGLSLSCEFLGVRPSDKERLVMWIQWLKGHLEHQPNSLKMSGKCWLNRFIVINKAH